jgi:hypothetical protein
VGDSMVVLLEAVGGVAAGVAGAAQVGAGADAVGAGVPPLASASVWALRALPPGAARGVGAAGALTGAIQAFRADARRGVKSGPVGAGGLSR